MSKHHSFCPDSWKLQTLQRRPPPGLSVFSQRWTAVVGGWTWKNNSSLMWWPVSWRSLELLKKILWSSEKGRVGKKKKKRKEDKTFLLILKNPLWEDKECYCREHVLPQFISTQNDRRCQNTCMNGGKYSFTSST